MYIYPYCIIWIKHYFIFNKTKPKGLLDLYHVKILHVIKLKHKTKR